jgi:hypothetical protein
MDIKTFVQVATSLPPDISILVKGDTGIGKSDITKHIASLIETKHMYLDHAGPGLPVLDWRLSVFSEGDIIGLPELVDGVTRFAPNDRFMAACREPHLLFLDEGNRATTEVLQCAFQIVLDRELNGQKLHPETRIIMAINEGNDFTVNEMDPALLRRFWVTELVPTTNDWLGWASKNNIDPMIQKFIKKYPAHLMHEGERNPGTVYPYPASWARLDKSLKHANCRPEDFAGSDLPDMMLHMSAGFIGMHTTAAFLDYVKNYVFKLSANDILNNFDDVEPDVKAMTNDKKNEALDQVVLFLKDNDICATQIENLNRFMSYVSDEVVVDFSQTLMATKNLHNIKMITTALKTRILTTVRGAGR